MIETLSMRLLGFAFAITCAACTKPNPKSCADGLCTDQAYPFCDVDGTLGGEPKECISVACTPNEFEACRGEQELRCNATGNNYDATKCELGCDATLDGCRLCEPNQVRCTNGKVAVCNPAGEVVSTEACLLGCFEDQPRCRRIDPSNNLGQYLDLTAQLFDFDLSNAVFEVDTGVVRVGAQTYNVPNFSVGSSGNGRPIRVWIAKSFTLQSATFTAPGDPRDPASSAAALVAVEDIKITGEVIVEPRAGGAVGGCSPGIGDGADNGGGNGDAAGSGGGGNATDGADGGAVNGRRTSGAKDTASGTPALVPLRGGCAGAYIDSNGANYHNGGGALQLTSNSKVEIDATIDIRGRVGERDIVGSIPFNGGGGAGGSLLIESSVVTLGPVAKLLATGGKGAQGCTTPSTYCGAGGDGATLIASATAGASVPYTAASNTGISGGGGGGGLGRIRINTTDGNYVKSNSAVETGQVTTGTVKTR